MAEFTFFSRTQDVPNLLERILRATDPPMGWVWARRELPSRIAEIRREIGERDRLDLASVPRAFLVGNFTTAPLSFGAYVVDGKIVYDIEQSFGGPSIYASFPSEKVTDSRVVLASGYLQTQAVYYVGSPGHWEKLPVEGVRDAYRAVVRALRSGLVRREYLGRKIWITPAAAALADGVDADRLVLS